MRSIYFSVHFVAQLYKEIAFWKRQIIAGCKDVRISVWTKVRVTTNVQFFKRKGNYHTNYWLLYLSLNNNNNQLYHLKSKNIIT